MKKTYSTLLFLTSIFAMVTVLRATCSGVTVFYGNGMNNSHQDSQRALDALTDKLKSKLPKGMDVDFKLAYNQKEGVIPQLVEVASQKGMDKWKSFWNYLADVEMAPDWFQTAARDAVAKADAALYVVDEDLRQQVEDYQNEIKKRGRRVIVIAHSQGNFYANSAYSMLDSSLFHIIGVASPSGYVAGNGSYINLTTDLIMNGLVPGNLPANAANHSDTNTGWAGHDFVSSYLDGDVTGPMLTKDVTNLMGDEIGCKEEEEKENPEIQSADSDPETSEDPLSDSATNKNIRLSGAIRAECWMCDSFTVSFDGVEIMNEDNPGSDINHTTNAALASVPWGEHKIAIKVKRDNVRAMYKINDGSILYRAPVFTLHLDCDLGFVGYGKTLKSFSENAETFSADDTVYFTRAPITCEDFGFTNGDGFCSMQGEKCEQDNFNDPGYEVFDFSQF